MSLIQLCSGEWNVIKLQKSSLHVVGYVFEKIKMGGNSLENKLFHTQHWGVICTFIASCTANVQQQCIERWYAVGYGKFSNWITSNFSFFFSPPPILYLSEQEETDKKETLDPNKLLMEHSMIYKMKFQDYNKMLRKIWFGLPARLCLQSRRKINLSGLTSHSKITTILLHQATMLLDFLLEVLQWYTSYIKGKGRKSIKHLRPMMLEESGRIKSEERNFRRQWESTMTGTVTISRCFVGNLTQQ